MDQLHSNTDDTSRKRGKHLTLDQRGAIQILKRQGLSLRAIADAVGCAHATIWYELRRGTPQRTSNRGRIPLYMAKRGQASYNEHRTHCRKPYKLDNDLFEPFMQWLVKQIREKHWSLDVCVGYAKLHQLFPKAAMVCTKTCITCFGLASCRLPYSRCRALFHASNTANGTAKTSACLGAALLNALPLLMNTRSSVTGKRTLSSGSAKARNPLSSRW